MILRFMGDIPEPKQQADDENQNIQQNLGQRKDRRLSNLIGLEQVPSQQLCYLSLSGWTEGFQ